MKIKVKESANDFAIQVCFLAFLYSSAPLNTKKSMCIFLYGNKLCLQKKKTQQILFSAWLVYMRTQSLQPDREINCVKLVFIFFLIQVPVSKEKK